MNATTLDLTVRKANAELDALNKEHEEIMASVEARLQVNRLARDVARAKRSEILTAEFLKVTHEDLCDPLTYQVVSEMVWDSVDYEASRLHVANTIFADTYVQRNIEYWGKARIMAFGIAVPRGANQEKLARTAELLAPVLKAAAETDEYARISILEDSCGENGSWHIIWDEEEGLFMLQGMHYYESEDLYEVMKHVPTYC